MQQKLQKLAEEYDNLLNSLEKIDYIAGRSKEGKAVINRTKNALFPQYVSLERLIISNKKD